MASEPTEADKLAMHFLTPGLRDRVSILLMKERLRKILANDRQARLMIPEDIGLEVGDGE